jgi:hypothetical protein
VNDGDWKGRTAVGDEESVVFARRMIQIAEQVLDILMDSKQCTTLRGITASIAERLKERTLPDLVETHLSEVEYRPRDVYLVSVCMKTAGKSMSAKVTLLCSSTCL